jgi:glycosyltransferase involved in cell wall biosynthesis
VEKKNENSNTIVNRNPVVALIIAYNEAERIFQTIRNLLPHVAEVIVGDTGSTDKTCEIARKAGARVVGLEWNNNFAQARNELMSATTREWCLFCDADEEFGDGFFELMHQSLFDLDDIDAFYIWRISEFDEQVVGEEFQPRLLRREKCGWHGEVHEGITTKKYANIPKHIAVMYHRHTMNRQRWNNLMYKMQKDGQGRPPENMGAEERDGKWVEFENERNG